MSDAPSRSRGKTIVFSLIPLLALYVLSETLLSTFGFEPFVGLQVFGPPVPTRKVSPWGDERDVIERICFGQPTVFETNFRAFLPPAAKPDGVRRVGIVGDSFVFGIGLPDEQTLPYLLGSWLHVRRPAAPVEVINFGWPGGNTTHYLQLAPRISEYAPDRVLVGITMSNDGETMVSIHEAPAVDGVPGGAAAADRQGGAVRPRASADPFGTLRVVRDAILEHSRTLSLLYRPVRRLEARWRQDRFVRLTFDDPGNWATIEKNMAAIAAHHGARGVPVTLLIFPHMFPSRHVGLNDIAAYPYRDHHARVRGLAEANGMDVLDVLELFETRRIPSFDPYIIDGDGHPNARYNALLAEILGERLLADARLAPPGQRPAGPDAGAPSAAAPGPAYGDSSQRSK